MVVFGAPIPRETLEERRDDAKAAIECAQAMKQAVRALNQCTQANPYKLRVGINSGEVVGGTLETLGAMRYNIIGETVNVAARVEAWSKLFPPDAMGNRPVCVTQGTAEIVGTEKFAALEGYLLHDDGEIKICIFTLK